MLVYYIIIHAFASGAPLNSIPSNLYFNGPFQTISACETNKVMAINDLLRPEGKANLDKLGVDHFTLTCEPRRVSVVQ